MNKFLSNVDYAMLMAILPETVRKNQKRNLKKRNMTSGPKSRKQELPIRALEIKAKKVKQ